MCNRFSVPIAVLVATTSLLIGCIRATPKAANSPTFETAEANTADNSDTVEVFADAGEVTRVRVTTDNGPFVIEVHPEWAPNGAEHWLKLAKMGYYDDTRFFRVIDGFMAQTGISGDPDLTEEWGEQTIPDDPVRKSNVRGYVTFAQTGQPNSRSTQWFINFGDNSFLDNSGQGFMPFGKIVEGMSVVDRINSEYGENNPADQVQPNAESRGNAFLDAKFPNLTKIVKVEILGEDGEPTGDIPKSPDRPQG